MNNNASRVVPRVLCMLPVSILLLAGCAAWKSESDRVSEDLLMQRAEGGQIDAQYELGQKYAEGPIPRTDKAIYWLCRASVQGDVPSQIALAELYQRKGPSAGGGSDGRLSNTGSAYFWYTAAASQGSDRAFDAREALAARMPQEEVLGVKRRATRWRKAQCVEP